MSAILSREEIMMATRARERNAPMVVNAVHVDNSQEEEEWEDKKKRKVSR